MTPIRTTASRLATALLCATVLAGPAAAQGQGEGSGKVRVGLMFTLSGPSAVLGEQGRDGFLLALDTSARSSAASMWRW